MGLTSGAGLAALRNRDFSRYLTSSFLATVGLAIPWATIRVARYRADNLLAWTKSPLQTYARGASRSATATGSEVSDLFDVDVSL